MDSELNSNQKKFCEEFVIDFNATRAYQKVYECSYDTARTNSSRMLTNANIKSYIKEIQKDLSKLSGVTALRNILELKKIAYSNISNFKDDWGKLKEWSELTENEKAALSEIQTEVTTVVGIETVKSKIKTHDKLKAINDLNKMLGFFPDKQIEPPKTVNIPIAQWLEFHKANQK